MTEHPLKEGASAVLRKPAGLGSGGLRALGLSGWIWRRTQHPSADTRNLEDMDVPPALIHLPRGSQRQESRWAGRPYVLYKLPSGV